MPYKNSTQQKEAQHQHYQHNKERYAEAQRRKRQRNKEYVAEYKADKTCERCPESHPACLEFHHTESGKKEIVISKAMYDWGVERIKQEISKCKLLCANCHRKLHYEEMKDRGIKLLYERNNGV